MSLQSNKIWFKTWNLYLTLLKSEDKNTKEYVEKRGDQNYTYNHIYITKSTKNPDIRYE